MQAPVQPEIEVQEAAAVVQAPVQPELEFEVWVQLLQWNLPTSPLVPAALLAWLHVPGNTSPVKLSTAAKARSSRLLAEVDMFGGSQHPWLWRTSHVHCNNQQQ